MKKLLLFLLFISSACKGQFFPGLSSASKNYSGGTEKTYVAIPDAPTLTDTHTLVYATTGSGIQSGDTGGKTSFFVSGDYPFMQFNVVNSDDYSMMSFVNDYPANWSVVGSPSPNDYSLDCINASHGISLYRLRFEGSDNLIKWPGTDTTLILKETYIENCIFRNAGFGGIIINQNVAGDGYGKFTSRFNSFTGTGAERHYLGHTGTSVQKYMDTTTVEHCYMDSSRREAVQCNNHKYVRIDHITARHGGVVTETPDQGIGQKNGFQMQGVRGGYVKNSIFEAVAPGMVASQGLRILNNRIRFSQVDRPLYFQDVVANGYHYTHSGDTVVVEGNDFECTGTYTLSYMFRIQEENCVYVFRNNRLPPSATDIYLVDGAAPIDIIVEGNTFDSDVLPPVTYGNPPETAYIGFQYVITSDYDYDLGRGCRTPGGI